MPDGKPPYFGHGITKEPDGPGFRYPKLQEALKPHTLETGEVKPGIVILVGRIFSGEGNQILLRTVTVFDADVIAYTTNPNMEGAMALANRCLAEDKFTLTDISSDGPSGTTLDDFVGAGGIVRISSDEKDPEKTVLILKQYSQETRKIEPITAPIVAESIEKASALAFFGGAL